MHFLSFLYDSPCKISLWWILMALKRLDLEEVILEQAEACIPLILLYL